MSAHIRAGAVSGTECRRRSKGRGHRSEQRERGPFRALKRLPLLLARHASEDASGAAGGCPQSVESAVLRAFEDASRTREGCFWHRISLPYRRSLFFTPNASENASRTPGSLFEHGMTTPPYPTISSAQWQRRPRHLPGHDGDWSGHSRTPPPQSGVGGSANCSRSASGR